MSSRSPFAPTEVREPSPPRRRWQVLGAGLGTALLALSAVPAAVAAPSDPASPAPSSPTAQLEAAPQAAAAAIPTEGLLAEYLFAQSTGNEVPNTAAAATFGAATVKQPHTGQWTGTSLEFNGGAKTSTSATWVQLPTDLLKGEESATITTEVKIDASMKSANHFLWNIGNANNTAYYFANTKDSPRTALTTSSNPGEQNAHSTVALEANRWASLTSVVDGQAKTITIYLDGVKVGSGATTLTPADVADQSLNTIGRAPWPDPHFKGEVAAFRVYDRALSAAEVEQVDRTDAALHPQELEAAAQAAVEQVGDQLTVTDSTTVLPSPGGAITYSSEDPALALSEDGGTLTVKQPAAGEPALSGSLTATATVRGISASKQVRVLVQPRGEATDDYGYLMVHFVEDSAGYAEKIYLDVSRGDDPEQWDPLNGGKPILASNLGTTGLRDPFLAYNPQSKTYFIIATDLRVFGGDSGTAACSSWCHWSTNGSPRLMVWESTDLITWSQQRELDVRLDADGQPAVDPGMAWAPEATWVPDFNGPGDGAFVVYFASKLSNAGGEYSRILWGSTSDFTQKTYSYGGVFIDAGGEAIDTTMIQDGNKTYRITKDNSQGKGIYMESTTEPRWWESGTKWTQIQTKMGAAWAGGNAGGVEGPAVFKRHDQDLWYLYVDVIPTTGYRPMSTTDLDAGFTDLRSASFYMAPSTKHGGIVSLTRNQYDAVRSADAVSVTSEDLGTVSIEATASEGNAPKAARAAALAGGNETLSGLLPASAEVVTAYGRGTSELPVDWDTSTVNASTPGTYPVTGTVRSIGANLNDWVGDGGSTAYDAPGRTLRSTTALTVTATVEVTEAPVTPTTTSPSDGADDGADGGSDEGSDGGSDGGSNEGSDGGADGGTDTGADGNSAGGSDGGAEGGSDNGSSGGTDSEAGGNSDSGAQGTESPSATETATPSTSATPTDQAIPTDPTTSAPTESSTAAPSTSPTAASPTETSAGTTATPSSTGMAQAPAATDQAGGGSDLAATGAAVGSLVLVGLLALGAGALLLTRKRRHG